ncbi:MAG: hypothetical protein K8F24_08800 [Bacteroidales bacterium]|nr:hypothetical protein [Bacteroidales bacterium]
MSDQICALKGQLKNVGLEEWNFEASTEVLKVWIRAHAKGFARQPVTV